MRQRKNKSEVKLTYVNTIFSSDKVFMCTHGLGSIIKN